MKFLRNLLASVLGFFIGMFLLFFVLSAAIGGIAMMAEEPVSIKENSVLVIRFEGEIKDRVPESPLGQFEEILGGAQAIGLNTILKGIKKAKTNSDIVGMYINCDDVPAGMATVTEIRNAILDFKESGKFVYAYNDNVSQKGYYLSSVADSVIINPESIFDFRGLSSTRTFYAKTLEKIGVDMQIIRGPNNDFKSAVEPFTNTKMSKHSRMQTEAYLNALWGSMLEDISKERNVPVAKLQELANEVLTLKPTSYVLENGLVDNLKYKDQIIEDMKMLSGIEKDKDIRLVSVSNIAKAPTKEKKKIIREKIAVIYGEGAIAEGEAAGIKGREFSAAVRKAREDDKVKAIVIRVNSPGGSAYSSEVIWREVELAQKVKPVVVSMGDVAASGGYYISCAAGDIMASPTTITGSIGIYAQIPNMNGLLTDKIGFRYDKVETNDFSEFGSIYRPLNAFERARMENYVSRGYNTFLTRVADGRKKTKEEINEIARGRVWAGTDALNNGLVDKLGGLQDAIALAAEKAELETYRISELPEIKDPFIEMLEKFSSQARIQFLGKTMNEDFEMYQHIKAVTQEKGVFTRLPYELRID